MQLNPWCSVSDGKYYQTLFAYRPDAISARVGSETLVICGTARGMTSTISFVCHEAGYFLGKSLGSQNYEDQDIYRIMPPRAQMMMPIGQGLIRSHLKRLARMTPYGMTRTLRNRGLEQLIKTRNALHPRWGFKLPYAGDYGRELTTLLRNPIFVVCVRNPLAISRSIAAREPGLQGNISRLRNAMEPIRTIETLQQLDVPFIAVDMDALKRHPDIFVDEFSQILNLHLPHDQVVQALTEPGYKRAAPQEGVRYTAA